MNQYMHQYIYVYVCILMIYVRHGIMLVFDCWFVFPQIYTLEQKYLSYSMKLWEFWKLSNDEGYVFMNKTGVRIERLMSV